MFKFIFMIEVKLAIFSALFAWFLLWHRYRVAENAKLISDHIEDIKKFSDELGKHWTTSFCGAETDSHRREIAKIKSLYKSISSFISRFHPFPMRQNIDSARRDCTNMNTLYVNYVR